MTVTAGHQQERILRITFAAWLLTSLASAQSTGPIVTDRPTQSVATFILAPKTFEIEGGYKFGRTEDGDPAGSVTELHELPDALFRFGVWRGIEARVAVSGWDFENVHGDGVEQPSTNGFNDVSVGGKFLLVGSSSRKGKKLGARIYESATGILRAQLPYAVGTSILDIDRAGQRLIVRTKHGVWLYSR